VARYPKTPLSIGKRLAQNAVVAFLEAAMAARAIGV